MPSGTLCVRRIRRPDDAERRGRHSHGGPWERVNMGDARTTPAIGSMMDKGALRLPPGQRFPVEKVRVAAVARGGDVPTGVLVHGKPGRGWNPVCHSGQSQRVRNEPTGPGWCPGHQAGGGTPWASRFPPCVPLALPVRVRNRRRTGRASGTQDCRTGVREAIPGLFSTGPGRLATPSEILSHRATRSALRRTQILAPGAPESAMRGRGTTKRTHRARLVPRAPGRRWNAVCLPVPSLCATGSASARSEQAPHGQSQWHTRLPNRSSGGDSRPVLHGARPARHLVRVLVAPCDKIGAATHTDPGGRGPTKRTHRARLAHGAPDGGGTPWATGRIGPPGSCTVQGPAPWKVVSSSSSSRSRSRLGTARLARS